MTAIPKQRPDFVPLPTPVFIAEDEEVRLPPSVRDLASFRQWADADDFPEHGRICWLKGELWIDMSKEQLFTHNQVKAEFTTAMRTMVREMELGYWFTDGARVSHLGADLSAVPDGVLVTFQSLEIGRIKLIEGAQGGSVELEGTPDLVLEVVSTGSVRKDTQVLRELYAAAGIAEYWLADVRGSETRFDILRLSRGRYIASRKEAAWVRSKVLGRSVRLLRQADRLGNPVFRIEFK
jgi:Uma2 family endonuclease